MTRDFTRSLAFGLIALAATAPAIAKEKKPMDPNKKVCRSEVATGTMLAKSTCHTAADWAQIDAANQASAQANLDRATRSGSPH